MATRSAAWRSTSGGTSNDPESYRQIEAARGVEHDRGREPHEPQADADVHEAESAFPYAEAEARAELADVDQRQSDEQCADRVVMGAEEDNGPEDRQHLEGDRHERVRARVAGEHAA